MEILNLALVNFRNFSSLKIAIDKNLTVIIGPNGAGKSNVLEALGMLAGSKSSRVETDLDLVKFGKSDAKIEGSAEQNNEAVKLSVNFQVIDELYVKKAYFVDSIKKRMVDFIDHFSLVQFAPLDLDLVCGSPSLRRHHLDTLLSSVDREYWRSISAYNKVMVRRNKVLFRISEGHSKPSELDFWDGRLLEHGKYVSRAREEFFEFLNIVEGNVDRGTVSYVPDNEAGSRLDLAHARTRFESSIHSRGVAKLLREKHPGGEMSGFSWKLKQSLLSEEKLYRNRDRDISAGMTLSGPHRDEFFFLYRDKNLEFFGSRGEQRMAVLALKLAELEYFALKRGSRPVLALDDIFSELDWEHREAVLGVIDKQQTIITAAEADSVPKKILKRAKIMELR